jgi:deleted in liver cancer protein
LHFQNDDSDDETYALSENWTFQPQNRRWSRVCEMGPLTINMAPSNHKSAPPSRESTPERKNPKTAGISLNLPLGPTAGEPDHNSKFRRTGSERLKDGAKAFLRRVESIKSRRRKRQNREGVIISGPQMLDLPHMNQKLTDLKCVDIYSKSNPSSPLPNSPVSSSGSNRHHFFNEFKNYQSSDGGMTPHLLSPSHFPKQKSTDHQLRTCSYQKSHSTRTSPLHFYTTISKDSKSGDDSSSYCSEGSQESSSGGGHTKKLTASSSSKKPSRTSRFLQRTTRTEDKGTLSDSECGALARKKKFSKDAHSTNSDLQVPKIVRGGSLNLGKESKKYREFFQNRSFRSKSSVRGEHKQSGGDSDRDDDSGLTLRSNRSAVVRWHSFQSPEKPNSLNIRIPSLSARNFSKGTMLTTMSCGQLQIIRKLSLVTLTGYMERYCPTHRSGFNWELSRFIKIMKTPDYKGE